MNELAGAVKQTIHDQDFLCWAADKGWKFRIVVYPEKAYMKEPIEALDLSVRSYNCLKRAGFMTIRELIQAINGRDDLKRFRNLGAKSADEIMLKLFLYQYAKMDETAKGKYLAKIKGMN